MKVNITGRGIIPGLGVIPPIYNKEMSIPAISRLLNFPNFSVFDATTGIRFTKKNIKTIAMNTQKPYAGVDVDPPKTPDKQTKVTPVVEKTTEPEPPVIEEVPVVESEEVTVVSEPEETTDVASDEEVVEEDVDIADEAEETETVDEKSAQQQTSNGYNNYNRKKNKKRH